MIEGDHDKHSAECIVSQRKEKEHVDKQKHIQKKRILNKELAGSTLNSNCLLTDDPEPC